MAIVKKLPKPAPAIEANENERATIGGNRPPVAIEARADFDEKLRELKADFDDRSAALVASAGRAVAIDAETAGRCGELKKQISAMIRLVDGAHTDAKAIYLEGGRVIDAAKKEKRGPLEPALASVQAKLDAYVSEENAKREAIMRRAEEKRRAEEAEQRAAEEAARAANAPPPEPLPVAAPPPRAPEPVQVRGDYGSVTSGKTVYRAEVTDYEVAFIAAGLVNNEKVRLAIDTAIAALVRSGVHQIEGVKVHREIVASVR